MIYRAWFTIIMNLQLLIVALLDVILDRRTVIVPLEVAVSLASVNELLVLDELEVLAPNPAFVGRVGLRELGPGLIEGETLDTNLIILAITGGQLLYEIV